jgi:hypothetical protein
VTNVLEHDTDVLVRQVDSQLALMRLSGGADMTVAERLGGSLRELIVSTTRASAVDRARVRAAVHYLMLRRSLVADLRVVNEIARSLGRDDLVVQLAGA